MKKVIPTTLIALLITVSVFSQREKGPSKNPSGGSSVNQASNSQVILLSPSDGKLFNSSDVSKPVLFRWTAVTPKPKEPVTYRLKVWQLMEGQNGVEAMRNNQPVITKDVINITQAAVSNLYTGPCKPPYLCDFIWAVEALNSEDNHLYRISDSYSFKYTGGIGTVTGSGGATVDIKSIDKELDKNQPVKSIDNESKELQPATHALHLPIEKIVYDADGHVMGMAIKSKNGGINILLDEAKIIETSKQQTGKLQNNREDYIKALQSNPATTAPNSRMSGTPLCWVQVFCHNPNHQPGCGWWELRPCEGGWNIDRPR